MSQDNRTMMDLIKKKYRSRIADARISDILRSVGGVLIVGPKWCGKSWTGIYHSNSMVMLDDKAMVEKASLYPKDMLDGERPRLVDEWQNAPTIWDTARREIDFGDLPGMFIFTGSVTPPEDTTMHSGVGRFARVMMRPMSLYESGHSTGSVSLSKMMESTEKYRGTSSMDPADILVMICRGGWPAGLHMDDNDAMRIPIYYVEQTVNTDLRNLYGEIWRPRNIKLLLKAMARNTATEAKVSKMAADISSEGDSISVQTTNKYLEILKDLFIVVEQEAWFPSMRSRGRVRTSVKRHLVDPSLATAAIGATPEKLKNDLRFSGFLFESLCFRDLSVYAEAMGGKVYYYRDKDGLEVDAIIEFPDGRFGTAEIKMGRLDFDKAAANLLRFKKKIAPESTGPEFMMILTAAAGGAYIRDDGVAIVPIDCLGP